MKKNAFVCFCLLLISELAFAQIPIAVKDEKEKVEFSMVVESETSYEFNRRILQKSELILTPELSYNLSKKLRMTGIGRVYSEWNDHLEPGKSDNTGTSAFSKRLRISKNTELELRELYVDFWGKNGFSARIGKQQIVWGETDGLKLLDVVNPQYFREFILDEFDESRIPLWSVKVDFPLFNNLDGQFVWIPDLTYHNVPGEGLYFPGNYFLPTPPEGMGIRLLESNKPDEIINDSDVGVKLSTFLDGWDLNFNYLYHYSDFQVFELGVEENNVTISPGYQRQHMAGIAFNKAHGAFVLRGEMAWHIGSLVATNDIESAQGLGDSDQVQSALGLDWTSGESFISVQVFNDKMMQNLDFFNRDQVVWSGSLLLSQEFMNDNLKIETLLIRDLNRGDGLIRPKVTYLLNSQLLASMSGDFFYGSRTGLFGQFDKMDRISIGFEWGI